MINNIFLDSAAVWVANCIHGHDEEGRLMRKTIIRYLILSLIITLRAICLPVKKRFQTYNHLVEAGLLEKDEKKVKMAFYAYFHVLL